MMLIEDDEIVAITADGVRVVGADGEPRERDEIVDPVGRRAAAEKGGYETYMLKEIHEQPQAISETLARNLRPEPLEPRDWRSASVGDRDLPASGAS